MEEPTPIGDDRSRRFLVFCRGDSVMQLGNVLVLLILAVPQVKEGPDTSAPDVALADVAGEYYQGDGLGVNCTLKLAKEGTFSFRWTGCLGEYDRNHGTAKITNGHLILKPARPNVREGFQGMATDLVPIKWKERVYLVGKKEAKDFCNSVNSGFLEPRNHAHGSFYLRDDDWKKKVDGQPMVPKEWQEWLLSKPIEGSVTNVLKDDKATMNLGTRDGVWIGLQLWEVDGRDGPVDVLAVEADSCTIRSSWDFENGTGFNMGQRIGSQFR
jgi:hypothetical protein